MPRARAALGVTFLVAGALHFLRPRPYVAIMPRYLPAHRELVYASGVAEMAGGAGVLPGKRLAGWWLIATLLAIFPANVEMAVHAERFRRFPPAAAVGAAAAAGRPDRLGVADRGAVAAAVAVAAARTGCACDDAVVLRDRLNVLVHLRPAPVVARVAGTIARRAPGRRLAAARARGRRRSLAARGRAGRRADAPSSRPARTSTTGRVLSFWTHVPARDAPVDPVAAGEALRDCHEALRDFARLAAGARRASPRPRRCSPGSPPRRRSTRRRAASSSERIDELRATLGDPARAGPAAARRRAPAQRAQRPGRAAVERLGGHVPRPGRLGRGLPARHRPDDGRRARGGGGSRRLRDRARPGRARAVGRGAVAAGARLDDLHAASTARAPEPWLRRRRAGHAARRRRWAPPRRAARPRRARGSTRLEIARHARIAPTIANPAPTMQRRLEALGQRDRQRARRSPSTESVRELATAARIARPSAPPTCWRRVDQAGGQARLVRLDAGHRGRPSSTRTRSRGRRPTSATGTGCR